MQGCAMRLGDGRISGIWLCGSDGYAPSRGFVLFPPYAGWQGIGSIVSFTPYAITYMGSLRIVEAQALWITEDYEIILECWRSGFVISIFFLRVRLVSGVFGC